MKVEEIFNMEHSKGYWSHSEVERLRIDVKLLEEKLEIIKQILKDFRGINDY
jgi:hypothetical protein